MVQPAPAGSPHPTLSRRGEGVSTGGPGFPRPRRPRCPHHGQPPQSPDGPGAGESLVETRWLATVCPVVVCSCAGSRRSWGGSWSSCGRRWEDPQQGPRATGRYGRRNCKAAEFRRQLTDRYNEFETFARHRPTCPIGFTTRWSPVPCGPLPTGWRVSPGWCGTWPDLGQEGELEVLGPTHRLDRISWRSWRRP